MIRAAYAWLARLTIYAVSGGGAVAIVVIQWGEAARQTGLGSSNYGQGVVGTAFLSIIIAGIPALLWAVISYMGLSWLLLRNLTGGTPATGRDVAALRTTTVAHSQWQKEQHPDFRHIDLDED